MATSIAQVLEEDLNPEQLAAAADPAPEVLTLACAGSGKSRTLAYRIAWLIAERKAIPAGIVAFTFTEKAADSIKLRVAQAFERCGIDVNLLGRMYIGTIHSYCQFLLGRIDARYRQFDVLDENRFKLYLNEVFWDIGLQKIKNRGLGHFATIDKVMSAWTTINEERVSPADVYQHDDELGETLQRLAERLERDQFIDFSLMQRLAVDALLGEDPLAQGAIADVEHLLVDEYQDINPIQEELIRALYSSAKTLFVVGDDDQSIYGWRGADVTRIQTFLDRYPDASEHTLGVNYRSTPLIVRSADHFAHQELGAARIPKNPTASAERRPSEMRVLWFDGRDDEADWVTAKIAELLGTKYVEPNGQARGLTPADFAILMRSTRQNEPNGGPPRHAAFTERLIDMGIPHSLEAGGGLFDRPHVAMLRNAFELLRDGQPDRRMARSFFQGEVQSLFPNASFNDLASVFAKWGRLIHAPVQGGPRRRIYPQQLLLDLLEACALKETQLDDGTLQDIGVFSRIMQDVESVYPSVDSTSRFKAVLNFLSQVADDGYDTSTGELVRRPDAVTVSTVHKMKGLEFPVVFVVDVENQRFPGRIRPYDGLLPSVVIKDSLARGAYRSTREEEARLFYTALTRAERFLYVTGAETAPTWKRRRGPSSFVAHLTDPEIANDDDTPTKGLRAARGRRRVEASNLPTSYSDLRYYLRCPRDYQYRKVFGFSPAIPELFGFGRTVHTAV